MNRVYRETGDATKQRISSALRGRSLSDSHRQAISDGMKAYWKKIPYRSADKNNMYNTLNNETNM